MSCGQETIGDECYRNASIVKFPWETKNRGLDLFLGVCFRGKGAKSAEGGVEFPKQSSGLKSR